MTSLLGDQSRGVLLDVVDDASQGILHTGHAGLHVDPGVGGQGRFHFRQHFEEFRILFVVPRCHRDLLHWDLACRGTQGLRLGLSSTLAARRGSFALLRGTGGRHLDAGELASLDLLLHVVDEHSVIVLGALGIVLGEPKDPLLLLSPHVIESLPHMSLSKLDLAGFKLFHRQMTEIVPGLGVLLLHLLQTLGKGRHGHVAARPGNSL